jgi:hypothetical protein
MYTLDKDWVIYHISSNDGLVCERSNYSGTLVLERQNPWEKETHWGFQIPPFLFQSYISVLILQSGM